MKQKNQMVLKLKRGDRFIPLDKVPKRCGVYIFYRNEIPLYIGKASNLKNRLQNYLRPVDQKIRALQRDANKLKIIKLNSNIEALIVESRLIKELDPRYNVIWRDDKNYFYVIFTKEKFPRIFITHQPILLAKSQKDKAKSNALNSIGPTPTPECIGPFTEGQSLKAVLRLIRRFFPYCTCQPHFRLCLNAQINNCPGYCCKKIPHSSKAGANAPKPNGPLKSEGPTKDQISQYQKNVRRIKKILTGKDKKFIKKLKDPYELLVLEKVWKHEPFLESQSLFPKSSAPNPNRVECYDISHLAGKEAVGAMTSWRRINNKWIADKNMWRKFSIIGRYTQDDPRMMEEVVSRRLNHPEWTYPDLIIIDGGITQLKTAKRALKNLTPKPPTLNPKIISFAKPQKLVFGIEKKPVLISNLPPELQNLIQTAISQTHNFVQRYHRQVRQKQFLNL